MFLSRTPNTGHRHSDLGSPTSGQAILELVVGLVAMLVIIAGLLQIGGLNRLHTRAMIQARSEAAEHMLSGATSTDAHYILDCTPGNDLRRYTRDDGFAPASSVNLQNHLLDYAQLELLQNARPNNPIVNLAANPDFGLVHGQMTYTTNLFPIVRDLIYNANFIDVHADAFMTEIEGLP
ncbi:MAG: hypothetical protein WCL16_05525 [bacterium]